MAAEEFIIQLGAELKSGIGDTIQAQLNQLNLKIKVDIDPEGIKSGAKTIKTITDEMNKAANARSVLTKSDTLSNNMATWLNKNSAAVKQYGDRIKELQSQLKDNTDASALKNITEQFKLIQSEANKASSAIKKSADAEAVLKKSSTLSNDMTTWMTKNGEAAKQYGDKIKELQNQLKGNEDAANLKAVTDEFKKIQSEVKKSTASAKQFTNELENAAKAQSILMKSDTLSNNMTTWLNHNAKAAKQYGERIAQLQVKLKGNTSATGLKAISDEFKMIQSEARSGGLAMSDFATQMKSAVKNTLGFGSALMAIQKGIQIFKSMYQAVYDIDTAMTNLYKVTDETAGRYQRFLDDAKGASQELGRSVSSYIEQSATWAKLGFNIDEAAELAKVSSIYANTAEVGDETAVSDLVTALKAYNIEAKNAITIADPLNELGNNFATSAADLGAGLAKSASTLSLAGTSLNETLAMITGGAEITQDASAFGNALRVAVMRIRGMKGALEEMGEEVDDNIESISKVQTQILNLTHGKVNIFDDKGDFRDYYEIMKDISEVFNEMKSTEQASLQEILFGKIRANQGNALIKAFQSGQVQKALETANQSAGSAEKEQERWLGSLEAKTAQATAAWQTFSDTILNSDFLKGAISGGTEFLNILTAIVDKLGVIPTLGAAIGAALSFKGVGFFDNDTVKALFSGGGFRTTTSTSDLLATQSYTDFSGRLDSDLDALKKYKVAVAFGQKDSSVLANILGQASYKAQELASSTDLSSAALAKFATSEKMAYLSVKSMDKSLSNTKGLIKAYNEGLDEFGLSSQNFIEGVSQGHSILAQYFGTVDQGKASIGGFIGYLAKQKAATIATTAATTALNMAVSMGISALMSFAVQGISYLIHYEENLIQKGEEAASNIENLSNSFNKLSGTIEDKGKRFAELAQGVNELTGANETLTTEEYEEFLSISNQLAELFPSLTRHYDENGNAIVNLSGDVDTVVSSLQNLVDVERELTNQKIAEQLPDLYKGLQVQSDAYEKQIKGYQDQINTINADLATDTSTEWIESNLRAMSEGRYINFAGFNAEKLKEVYKDVLSDFGVKVSETTGGGGSNILEAEGLGGREADFEKMSRFIRVRIGQLTEYRDEISRLNSQIAQAERENKANWSSALKSISAWLNTDDTYAIMSDEMQAVVQTFVNNLDFSSLGSLENAQQHILENIVGKITSGGSMAERLFKEMFELPTGDMSVKEYESKIKDYAARIAYVTDMSLDEVLSGTGMSDKFSDIETKIHDISIKLSDFHKNAGEKFDDSFLEDMSLEISSTLSTDEIERAFDYVTNYGVKSWDRLQELLNSKALEFNFDYEAATKSFEHLNSAMSESVSATGLTEDTIKALRDRYNELPQYDPSALFEKSVHGLKLNTEEIQRLEGEYGKFMSEGFDGKLKELQTQYEQLGEDMSKCGDEAQRLTFEQQREAILKEIRSVSDLATQYQGLTSAYNEWTNAQQTADQDDAYNQMSDAIEKAKEIYNSGRVGTDDFRAFAQFMTDADLASASVDEVVKAYEKGLPAMERYFTGSDEGLKTFIDDLETVNEKMGKNWITQDKDGNYTLDFGVSGDDDVAKAFSKVLDMQVSTEQLQTMLQALEAYGWTVNLDNMYEEFDELRTEAEKANDTLVELGKTDVHFRFSSDDTKVLDDEIAKAKELLDTFKNPKTGKLNLEMEGAEEAQEILKALLIRKEALNSPLIMDVETEGVVSEVADAIKILQDFQTAASTLEIGESLGLDTTDAQANLDAVFQKVQEIPPDIQTKLGIDGAEGVQATLDAIAAMSENPEVLKVIAEVDPELVEQYMGEEKQAPGVVEWRNNTTLVDNYMNTLKVSYAKVIWRNDTSAVTPPVSSATKVEGSAQAKGSAYADGDWGIGYAGRDLGGELGPEILVRDGKYYIIGENGAEFFKHKKDDIIFNHKQSEELLKNGHVFSDGGRGKAYVSGSKGNAYSSATGPGRWYGSGASSSDKDSGNGSGSGSGSSSSSKSSSSSNDSDDEPNYEKIDWIERAVAAVERSIKKLGDIASSAFRAFRERISASVDSIDEISKEITLQQQAYSRYLTEAESVALSGDLKQLVRDGIVDIREYDDETRELISEYQEWYDKAVDADEKILELTEQINEAYKEQFELIEKNAQAQLDAIDFNRSKTENRIDYIDSVTGKDSSALYEDMASYSRDLVSDTMSAVSDLKQQLDTILANNPAFEGTEAYNDMISTINDLTLQYMEEMKNAAEYDQKVYTARAEYVGAIYDAATEELEHFGKGIESKYEYNEITTNKDTSEKYNSMAFRTSEELGVAQQKAEELKAILEEGLASGVIEEGSDAFRDLTSQINDAEEAVWELRNQQAEYEKEYYNSRFEYVTRYFENRLDELEYMSDLIQTELDDLELEGLENTAGKYERLASVAKTRFDTLTETVEGLQKELDEAVASGKIVEGTSEWKDKVDTIRSYNLELQKTNTLIREYRKEIYAANAEFISGQYERAGSRDDYAVSSIQNAMGILSDNAGVDVSGMNWDIADIKDYEIKELSETIAALEKNIANGVANGDLQEGEAKWQELTDSLNDYKLKLQETIAELGEYRRAAFTEKASFIEDQYGAETDELDHIENMINTMKEAHELLSGTDTSGYSLAIAENYHAMADVYRDELEELKQNFYAGILSGDIVKGTKDYNDLAGSIRDVEEALADAAEKELEYVQGFYTGRFNFIEESFNNQLGAIQNISKLYQNEMKYLTASGSKKLFGVYDVLITAEESNLKALEKEANRLNEAMDDALESGAVKEGTDAFYEMRDGIAEVVFKIQDATANIKEMENALRDLSWEMFDRMADGISDIVDESDFFRSLLGENKNYDKYGKMTGAGAVNMGLLASSYSTQFALSGQYAEEIKKIDREIADDPANTELIDRRKELIRLQRQAIQGAYDERDAMVSLVKEGIDAQLASLKRLIDEYEKSLDSAKSLYDYQQNISEQTENIASLRKQLAAYAGDNSEEGMFKRQQLGTDLEKAEKKLEETQYDRYISDQKSLLDKLYTDYETVLNARLDNIDVVIRDCFAQVNADMGTIYTLTKTLGNNVGYQMSDGLTKLLQSEATAQNINQTGFSALLNNDVDQINKLLSSTEGLKTTYLTPMGEKLANVDEVIEKVKTDTAALYTGTIDGLKSVTDKTVALDTDVVSKMTGVEGTLGGDIEAVKGAVDGLADNIDAIPAAAVTAVDEFGNKVYAGQEIVADAISDLQSLGLNIDGATGAVDSQGSAIRRSIIEAGATTNGSVKEISDLIKDDVVQGLANGTSTANAAVNAFIGARQIWNDIRTYVKDISEKDFVIEMPDAGQLMGDVDKDGFLTEHDLYLIGQMTGDQIDTALAAQLSWGAADVDMNGVLTAQDYTALRKRVRGYASGGYVGKLSRPARNGDDLVAVNTLMSGEAVLSRDQAAMFKDFVSYLPLLTDKTGMSKYITSSTVNSGASTVNMGGINVTIPIDHVSDYNDFVNQLRSDKKFEKLMQSITVDVVAGKNTLAKNKYTW